MTLRTLITTALIVAVTAPAFAQDGGNKDEGPPIPPYTKGDGTEVELTQFGRTLRASVAMKHDSCGSECNTHSLAGRGVSIEVPADLSVTCDPGHHVTYAAYQVEGQLRNTLVNINTHEHSYASRLELSTHSSEEVETACRNKFGNWPDGYEHPMGSAQQTVELERVVTAYGKCTGDRDNTTRRLTTRVQVTCIDQDAP